MKKKAIYLLMIIALILILASPAYAEGGKWMGGNATGPAYAGELGSGSVDQHLRPDRLSIAP